MPPLAPVKILFVGDVHLGRQATRLPAELRGDDKARSEAVGPLTGLRRAVRLARSEQVQAVAFAGDLVHAEQNLFAARRQLEEALQPLREDGIPVVAVAGNHDTRILSLLGDTVDDFHLLGQGGTWSCFEVATGVRLVGWSFPARHHPHSPLREAAPPPEPGVVSIGLLHADLDAAGSRYAPVSSTELASLRYNGWALGHIHAPDPVPAKASTTPPFYLGSLTGVPPTETGPHGPVLATVGTDGTITWQRRAIAPWRWRQANLSVTGISPERVDNDPVEALRAHLFGFVNTLDTAAEPDFPLLALGLRVVLTGSHPAARALQAAAEKLRSSELITGTDGCLVFVDKITSEVELPVDLVATAEKPDPPGLLARRILALEAGDESMSGIIREARDRLNEVPLPAGFKSPDLTEDEVRRHLARAGRQALSALLGQRAGGSP